jgi:hypothetical protein
MAEEHAIASVLDIRSGIRQHEQALAELLRCGIKIL